MSRDVAFSEMSLQGVPLSACELALECANRSYRLYVLRQESESCFYAQAVEFSGCTSDGDVWACPDLQVTPLFNCVAYFDGVRHLEFNREAGDMAGYIYYPDIQGMVELFSKIREIELSICWDCDK